MSGADDDRGQPSGPPVQGVLPGLVRASIRPAPARRSATEEPVAEVDPVARVLVEVALAHLDRPFDYAVPATMADDAVPGARVRVRFAGQDVQGFVVERAASSDHAGRLQPLRRVVSAEPVLTAEVAALTGAVAQRYAGTRSDVLRLAVPARHARTEQRPVAQMPDWEAVARPESWTAYDAGPALLGALAAGSSPRAVWSALPGDDWAGLLAEALVATAVSGRGALACVPDRRDLDRLDAALTARLGRGHHAVLSAEQGPARRYGAFLAASRGRVRIVVGTRAAALAPVADLGLVAIWDDGDDLHDEPRAPYPHAREVLLLRAATTGCAALVGGVARSVEAEYLLRTDWAREVAGSREEVRRRVAVRVAGGSDAALERDPLARSTRLPREAFETVRAVLASGEGPVLVQTPRAGYATRLACETCRAPAECDRCHGPLRVVTPARPPECAWCATPAPGWICAECGGHGLRAPSVGERRTAEELGRAFPSVPVRSSAGDHVLATVPAGPALVVATPGAEPVAEGGYAAVLLLDTWWPLVRPDLRAAEEALRRWLGAAALVRAPAEGLDPVPVLLVGDPGEPALQAAVRWDPAGFARREIEERRSAHLPPASRMASLVAPAADVAAAASALAEPGALPFGAELLGPVPVLEEYGPVTGDEARVRLVVRVPRAAGTELSTALARLQATRSAHKQPHVRVEVDPVSLG